MLVAALIINTGCGGGKDGKSNLSTMANKIGRKTMVEDYPKVFNEELIRETAGNRIYGELQNRYSQQLVALKAETDRDHAKLLIVIMTPEVGKFATNANIYGVPFIVQICGNQGIECIDLTPDISEWSSVNEPGRMPVGGNWSREGAAFVADMLAGVVSTHEEYRNRTTFEAAARPATFGDARQINEEDEDKRKLNPQDGEKRGPYKLTINKQGLRMGHELTFPKTRQRILFLGDSRIFNPYMDDQYTITERLQARFPEKEIVNAGNLSYTMDDYLSLYREKARYTEPDIVVVCTSGGDILDEYFTHRNRYSRSERCYRPSALEEQFYRQMTKTN
jgi:hypothetical protein